MENISAIYTFTKKNKKFVISAKTYSYSVIPNELNNNLGFEFCISVDGEKNVNCGLWHESNQYSIRFHEQIQNYDGVIITEQQYNEIWERYREHKKKAFNYNRQYYKNEVNSYLSGEKEIPLKRVLNPQWSPFAAGIGIGDENYEQICAEHMVFVCNEEIASQLLINSGMASRYDITCSCILYNELNGKIDISKLKAPELYAKKSKKPFESHSVSERKTMDEGGETTIYYHKFKANGKMYEFCESNLYDCGISIYQIKGDTDETADKLYNWLKYNGALDWDDIRM